MKGRTANALKNHYNQNLKKRVAKGQFVTPSDLTGTHKEKNVPTVKIITTEVKTDDKDKEGASSVGNEPQVKK